MLAHFTNKPPKLAVLGTIEDIIDIPIQSHELPVHNVFIFNKRIFYISPILAMEYMNEVVIEYSLVRLPAYGSVSAYILFPCWRSPYAQFRMPLAVLRLPNGSRRVRYWLSLYVGAPAASTFHTLHRCKRAVRTTSRNEFDYG